MAKGDFIIYYSGKQTLGKTEKCQKFTALGEVKDDKVYDYQVSDNFCPSRRNIEFIPSRDTPVLPLINDLDFIENKRNWGYKFRLGFFEINRHDFELISSKMLNNNV